VALEGQDRDQVVVIGNEVDVSCLTSSLRKKVGHATIVSVEEVKPKPDDKKTEGDKDKGKTNVHVQHLYVHVRRHVTNLS